jgi:HAD superfamily hydrolase (TIGR01459 family)
VIADPSPSPVTAIRGLSQVADRYEGFVLDLWGVLYDGERPYPLALEALRALARRRKRIAVLSNGPRRAAAVAERMAALGITPDLYDVLHSSGEETWQSLKDRSDPWYTRLGRRAFLLVPERDRGLLDGLDIAAADSPAEAEFILLTGTARPDETVADYEAVLAEGARRRLPMVCANPDLEVMRAGVREICAGALAQRYEALGGFVRYHGKPDPSVYRTCFAALRVADRARILAVGDSLRTDIAGAMRTGIDSVFVVGGIHAEELGDRTGGAEAGKLTAACARTGIWPTYAMPILAW